MIYYLNKCTTPTGVAHTRVELIFEAYETSVITLPPMRYTSREQTMRVIFFEPKYLTSTPLDVVLYVWTRGHTIAPSDKHIISILQA